MFKKNRNEDDLYDEHRQKIADGEPVFANEGVMPVTSDRDRDFVKREAARIVEYNAKRNSQRRRGGHAPAKSTSLTSTKDLGPTAVFKAQSKTFSVARQLSKKYSNTSTLEGALKKPFCLRVLKNMRTPEIQSFRNHVASVVRQRRLDKTLDASIKKRREPESGLSL